MELAHEVLVLACPRQVAGSPAAFGGQCSARCVWRAGHGGGRTSSADSCIRRQPQLRLQPARASRLLFCSVEEITRRWVPKRNRVEWFGRGKYFQRWVT